LKTLRRLWLPRLILSTLLTLTVLAGLPGDAQATPSRADESLPGVAWSAPEAIVEHLRMKVPAEARRTWLELELQIWDPWLRRQPGFLGRELLWDPQSEEGILLIRWVSRAHWHSIPSGDIEAVQGRFEQQARLALAPMDPRGHFHHPFPLVHAGELHLLMTTGAAAAVEEMPEAALP
jgi:uncharacterized protein (TIGR03792 family)